MKNTFLTVAMTAAALLLTGYANLASAHSQSGSLGTAAGATDLYQVTCSDDGSGTGSSYKLATSITVGYMPYSTRVSVRTEKGSKATNTTDPVNGDSLSSPYAYNIGGDGVYYMSVGHTTATNLPRSYVINFHCVNSAGGHTGTTWVMLQNQ